MVFYNNLNDFAKSTQNFDNPQTVKFRNVLAKAKDPEKTFFEDLPAALFTATIFSASFRRVCRFPVISLTVIKIKLIQYYLIRLLVIIFLLRQDLNSILLIFDLHLRKNKFQIFNTCKSDWRFNLFMYIRLNIDSFEPWMS